jgi:tRNA(Arg) A34 adenosine deaminase TadA
MITAHNAPSPCTMCSTRLGYPATYFVAVDADTGALMKAFVNG